MSPTTVRAKFNCFSVTKQMTTLTNLETGKMEYKPIYSFEFSAVTSGSDENKKFFAFTPSGNVKLSSLREDMFEIGKEYYLDFILASEE
jgi:hypothetical protein